MRVARRVSLRKSRIFGAEELPNFEPIALRLDVIDKLCCHLELHGIQQEGIFRLSGNKTKILELWGHFDQNVDSIELYDVDPHIIAGALKLYLRSQNPPLVPFELFNNFCDAVDLHEDPVVQLTELLKCVDALPHENKPILRRLLQLLSETSKNSEINKMTAENLGIVFGPTLMRSQDESDIGELSKSHLPAKAFTLLILQAERVTNQLPKGVSNYRSFNAPQPLQDNEWKLLLTNATTKKLQSNQVVLGEGELNHHMYRVVSGKFRVEKGDTFITILETGSVFGEMSSLGRLQTSASVISEGNGEVQVMEWETVAQMFSLYPHLFMKFYWNMAYKLGQMLQGVDSNANRRLRRTSTISTRVTDVSKQENVIRVYSKEEGFWTFPVDNETKFVELLAKLHERLELQKPDQWKIYQWHDQLDQPIPVNPEEFLRNAPKSLPGFKLIFSDSLPVIQVPKVKFSLKAQTIIKDYPCKLAKKNGRLYIMQHHLAHFTKLLGLEKKVVIALKDMVTVINDEPKDGIPGLTVISKGKKEGAISKFVFKTSEESNECFKVIQAVWGNYQNILNPEVMKRRRRSLAVTAEQIDNHTCAEEVDDFTRGLVLQSYHAMNENELDLKEGDTVIITQKIDTSWWMGQCNGKVGLFPSKCVDEIYQAETASQLKASGNKNAKNLPTAEDWKLILTGGKEVKFKANEVILKEGDRFQRIFQITSGSCRIEKAFHESLPSGPTKTVRILGHMRTDETFGEISFLVGDGATASVIADEDHVEVYLIDAEYLKRLFARDNALAGRFFKYLSTVLERRLRLREQKLHQGP